METLKKLDIGLKATKISFLFPSISPFHLILF